MHGSGPPKENRSASGATARLREMIEPTARKSLDALKNAHFLDARRQIESYFWGFELRGHVMATARLGEVGFRLSLSIAIPGEGCGANDIRVDSRYVVSFYEGEKAIEEVFWEATTTFAAAGNTEKRDMQELLEKIVANFRRVVRRVLHLAEGHP
jgi:hypothetical protein